VPESIEPPASHLPSLCALRVKPWDSCVETAGCHKVREGAHPIAPVSEV
jgi:hypothetical protein